MSDSLPAGARVAVTGASGLIGSALVERLGQEGHAVLRLVRRPARGADELQWDPGRGELDPAGLAGVDAAVHLAGENLAGRWTPERKARMVRSRVSGTRTLAAALAALPEPPRVLVSASAIGIYGADRGEEVLTEDSEPGGDFMGELGRAWEEATEPAERAGVRVARLRFGIVLSSRGGALAKMLLPFRLGLGGRVGSGRQWMSWVALDDVVEVILRALEDERLTGHVNVVAGTATNRDFTAALGRVLRRPTLLPVPVFALRAVYGAEMLESTLLASQRVDSARLRTLGHRFRFPELEGALRQAVAGG